MDNKSSCIEFKPFVSTSKTTYFDGSTLIFFIFFRESVKISEIRAFCGEIFVYFSPGRLLKKRRFGGIIITIYLRQPVAGNRKPMIRQYSAAFSFIEESSKIKKQTWVYPCGSAAPCGARLEKVRIYKC